MLSKIKLQNIYRYTDLKINSIIIVTLLFFIVSLFGIINHELWLDESHHFLLGRDSTSLFDLYKNSRYDGHPILWNYLIHLSTRVTSNPLIMQVMHVNISTLVVFVFLKKAPFSLWFKIIFLLSYFMLYEYTIISRNYNLGLLFLFLSCSMYSRRNTNFKLLCFYLAMCCNTHSIFIIISIALLFILFLEQLQTQKSKVLKTYWKGYLIFIIGFFIACIQIIPNSDSTFFSQIDYSNNYEVFKSGTSFFKALFPIVDFTQKKYWNTFYFLEHFKTIGIGLSLLVWILPIILFNKKRNTLIFVYLTFIGFILFEIITRRYGVRYNGLLFLTLIVGLWISSMQKELLLIKKDISRYNHYIILIVMFCQCIGGTVAYALDLKKPFNYGKTVSEYIQDNDITTEIIITTCESASINTYLGENLHHICYGKRQGFYLWNKDCSEVYNLTDKEVITLVFLSKPNEKTLFLICAQPFKTKGLVIIEANSYTVTSIKNFTNSVTQNYYIYSIEKK